MKKSKEHRTLEESAQALRTKAALGPVSIGDILELLSGKGRSLILMLLSLPFCQPIQIPGFSTPFGLVIAFLGLRMAFGKHIWLPKSLLAKEISAKFLLKITDSTLKLVKKARRWIYPRLVWVCRHPIMEILNGLMIVLLGIFLALPLPIPFSNLIAAWSIFLIGFGILEDDGLLVIIGYVMSLLSLIVLVFLLLQIKLLF
ncbi:MAG: exopolysaccharide biosynthesis protein [Parachlamydiaceae bacterium]|nr:exopolysaccharide biosynthesis protein [Parachlamydiaceae bacterium]